VIYKNIFSLENVLIRVKINMGKDKYLENQEKHRGQKHDQILGVKISNIQKKNSISFVFKFIMHKNDPELTMLW